MNRAVISEIQVWSVARTVFPLGWIVSSIVIFCSFMLIGGAVANLAVDYPELPEIPQGIGVMAGILFSVVAGFLSTIGITLLAVIVAAIYNFLAGLGGGISISLSEPLEVAETAANKPEAATAESREMEQ